MTTLISQPQRILLLIDDNPADRQLVKRYLQRDREHDYVFVEAETGERGLKQCLAEPPDCILIDYDLPDISGLELLTELTGTSERTIFPIVIMTGVGNEMVAVQSMQRGAQEYLIKNNITPETLLITVDNAIKKVHMRLRVEAQQQHLHEQNKELQQRQQEIHALNIRLQRSMTESHHRIKNNLQTLASLVNMYTMDNPEMVPVSALKRLEQHIQTLASLHDLLTQEAKTDADFDTINLKASLDKLSPMIQSTAGERRVFITAQDVRVPLKQGNAFMLLTNELLSNSLKHGKGDVLLTLSVITIVAINTEADAAEANWEANTIEADTVERNLVHMEVTDDGPGFPSGFDPILAANTGLELVDSISRHDLQGTILYENRPQGGASVKVIFPVMLHKR